MRTLIEHTNDTIAGRVGDNEVILARFRNGRWGISSMSNTPDFKNLSFTKKLLNCQLMVIADMEELNNK